MEIQATKVVCFSPTGTTRAVAVVVGGAINCSNTEVIDVTSPAARAIPLKTASDELLVVAVPVYSGRIPTVAREWLRSIEADGSPVVCIVVYGNRAYDDALAELKDVMEEAGCVTVACAAFIGEHSFSCKETPIAVSRPDESDLSQALLLGQRVGEVLRSVSFVNSLSGMNVPGNHPFREPGRIPDDVFISVGSSCTQCGICAEVCPVNAIDPLDSTLMDMNRCIFCCACIKKCPENAKTVKEGVIRNFALRLSEMCRERKEPVFFFHHDY